MTSHPSSVPGSIDKSRGCSAPRVELGVPLGELVGGLVWRPWRELEVEWLDVLELGPVPRLGAERATLGGQQRAVNRLDLRDVRLDAETVADRFLEPALCITEGRA